MMQYPLYAGYPFNFYPYYNNCRSPGYNYGQTYATYYGYQPNSGMQQGTLVPRTSTALGNPNGYYPNYQGMGAKYYYPQYSPYFQWPYTMTNWYNPHQSINQMHPWGSFYYDKWPTLQMNFNAGMYYSWPMMSYYSNQMMFPNYLSPSPTYWGVQQTIDLPQSNSKQTTSQHDNSKVLFKETKPLNVTSSEVIRDFNLPPAVAKRTRSDIPRPTADCSDIKEAEKSKDEMELPYLFRVSDTSIKQIASSRSFGPSMVYNTESDNKPMSSHWKLL